ncbi:hypothetical protein ACFY1L_21485 [Streptomyces sp. NPDC001663]|uniref:hypothetical protein n=1 Tax=Streptomyces sp. NPDC001663 TaxID=3364597 RepID=UPI00368A6703
MSTDMAAAPAGARVLPVLTVPEPATAAPLADALGAGGAIRRLTAEAVEVDTP